MRLGPFRFGRQQAKDEFDCQDVVENCSDYVDGELAAAQVGELQGHLNDCPDCDTFVSTFRATVMTLRDLPRKPAPSELAGRIQSAINTERPT